MPGHGAGFGGGDYGAGRGVYRRGYGDTIRNDRTGSVVRAGTTFPERTALNTPSIRTRSIDNTVPTTPVLRAPAQNSGVEPTPRTRPTTGSIDRLGTRGGEPRIVDSRIDPPSRREPTPRPVDPRIDPPARREPAPQPARPVDPRIDPPGRREPAPQPVRPVDPRIDPPSRREPAPQPVRPVDPRIYPPSSSETTRTARPDPRSSPPVRNYSVPVVPERTPTRYIESTPSRVYGSGAVESRTRSYSPPREVYSGRSSSSSVDYGRGSYGSGSSSSGSRGSSSSSSGSSRDPSARRR